MGTWKLHNIQVPIIALLVNAENSATALYNDYSAFPVSLSESSPSRVTGNQLLYQLISIQTLGNLHLKASYQREITKSLHYSNEYLILPDEGLGHPIIPSPYRRTSKPMTCAVQSFKNYVSDYTAE